jgi:phosphate transport system protein
MGELSHTMLHQCLDAYVKRDIAIARGLSETDAIVDNLEDEAHEQIRTMIKNNVATLESGLILIEITYMLERLADRTTNIGERVIFMINSSNEELNT